MGFEQTCSTVSKFEWKEKNGQIWQLLGKMISNAMEFVWGLSYFVYHIYSYFYSYFIIFYFLFIIFCLSCFVAVEKSAAPIALRKGLAYCRSCSATQSVAHWSQKILCVRNKLPYGWDLLIVIVSYDVLFNRSVNFNKENYHRLTSHSCEFDMKSSAS